MQRILGIIGILSVGIASWSVFNLFSPQFLYFYLMVVAAIVIPIFYWMRRSVRWPAVIFLGIALTVSLIPIDFTIQSTGRPALVLMPVSFSYTCDHTRAACYGDVIWHNGPKYALVLGY